MNPDIDRLLRRRLYLQRYVTSLFNDVIEVNTYNDKRLIALLNEFVADANEKTLIALSRQRTSNEDARAVLAKIKSIVAEQKGATKDLLTEQMAQLIEREAVVTTAALDKHAEAPSTRGVVTLPIAGSKRTNITDAAYIRYQARLISEVTQAAASNPQDITKIVRGTRAQNYRDGLYRWRNDRLIRPNIDQIVNGTASNAANHVYETFKIEKVDHLATLDYRTCPQCITAEINSPYVLGKQPKLSIHPNCRCVNVPAGFGKHERPYVKDERSVKDIPKHERPGKIGQTRDTIEQFFNRMSKADRRAYMGKSRAELWEAGKIDDIRDLVNERNLRPLRLDELPEL